MLSCSGWGEWRPVVFHRKSRIRNVVCATRASDPFSGCRCLCVCCLPSFFIVVVAVVCGTCDRIVMTLHNGRLVASVCMLSHFAPVVFSCTRTHANIHAYKHKHTHTHTYGHTPPIHTHIYIHSHDSRICFAVEVVNQDREEVSGIGCSGRTLRPPREP